jgi:aminopeptidase YwaD
LAQYQLESPVRFVFVNAEEVGIIGSTVWAKQANANNVPIDGVFNVDSVGSDRQGRLIILNSDARSAWMQDILISTNSAYGLGQHIESRQNPQIVADDNMVRNEGIDAVMIAREVYGWSPLHHTGKDVAENVSIDNVLSMTYRRCALKKAMAPRSAWRASLPSTGQRSCGHPGSGCGR